MRMPGSIVMQVTLKLDHETVYSHQYKIGSYNFYKMNEDFRFAMKDVSERLIVEVSAASHNPPGVAHAEPPELKP